MKDAASPSGNTGKTKRFSKKEAGNTTKKGAGYTVGDG